MRYLRSGFYCFIFLILFIGYCGSFFDCNGAAINKEDILGQWFSAKIIYPKKSFFKNNPPDTEPGKASLLLEKNGHFVFIWDKTNVSGVYGLDKKHLFLTSSEHGDTVKCALSFKNKSLTIELNDGFILKFTK